MAFPFNLNRQYSHSVVQHFSSQLQQYPFPWPLEKYNLVPLIYYRDHFNALLLWPFQVSLHPPTSSLSLLSLPSLSSFIWYWGTDFFPSSQHILASIPTFNFLKDHFQPFYLATFLFCCPSFCVKKNNPQNKTKPPNGTP